MRPLALTAGLVILTASAAAQPPADAQPKTPVQLFREAEALIADGRFDVAAERLKAFLAANPTDADFLAITRTDPAAFAKLRRVVVWSEEPNAQAAAVKAVNDIQAKAEQAVRTVARDEARIRQFVQNLGNIREERLFAIQQLRLSGDAVVPVMVDELRTNSDPESHAGIYEAVTALGADVVPGFLAATAGLGNDLKLGLLRAITSRRDAIDLLSTAETDYTAHLWRYSAGMGDGDQGPLRAFAVTTLDRLTGGRSAKANPTAELVKIADTFARHKARFRNSDPIPLWTWDAAKTNVQKTPVTKGQAEEYYAVRAVKWALENSPNDPAAQDLFLAVTTERAVERSGLRDLAQTDPTLYRILVAAPTTTLVGLLDQALTDNRTALVLGLTQVLAVRSDRAATVGVAPGQPGVFARAIDYPDARVQLAAAVGLIRSPGGATHGKSARVVEVLRRAAAADTDPAAKVGRALIADPLDARAVKTTRYLQELGYATERFRSGRELLRRVDRAADYDLIVLDRHVVAPELPDVLAQLRTSANASRRPLLVVASADKLAAPPLEHLLLRLALLVAATDPAGTVTPPFHFDPRRTVADEAKEREDNRAKRDRELAELFAQRLARLTRLVDAAHLGESRDLAARLDLRLPQLTLAALAAKFPVGPQTAPTTAQRLTTYTALIRNQPTYVAAIDAVPTVELARIVEHLETTLDGKPEERAEFDGMLGRIEPAALAIAPDALRDPLLEERLSRLTRQYAGVTVVPEPFALGGISPAGIAFGFRNDVEQATATAAQRPSDPAARKQMARTAVEWLRRLAVGEVPGYDIRPAEPALRQALKDDELADPALDAVARIPTAEAQQDLLTVAVGPRPVPLRTKAAVLTVRHIQGYGKFIPVSQVADLANQTANEPVPELRANLQTIFQLIAGKPEDLGRLMAAYPIPLPQPPKAAEPPAEKKPDEKKGDEGKN